MEDWHRESTAIYLSAVKEIATRYGCSTDKAKELVDAASAFNIESVDDICYLIDSGRLLDEDGELIPSDKI